MSQAQSSLVIPSALWLAIILLMILMSDVLSQQVVWTQGYPARMPVRFTPLPLLMRNFQGSSQIGQKPVVPRKALSPAPVNPLSMMPPLGGKLRLLSTLFGGLRNSGLEATIAGEIIQRLIKSALRDIIIPLTSDVFSPLLS